MVSPPLPPPKTQFSSLMQVKKIKKNLEVLSLFCKVFTCFIFYVYWLDEAEIRILETPSPEFHIQALSPRFSSVPFITVGQWKRPGPVSWAQSKAQWTEWKDSHCNQWTLHLTPAYPRLQYLACKYCVNLDQDHYCWLFETVDVKRFLCMSCLEKRLRYIKAITPVGHSNPSV